MNFIDYMRSLPAEGEVFLLVKQKPLQPLQYHANGLVKSTYPAFINPKIKPGESWYGNTAAYITERMADRVSAATKNCEYVVVLILDDVGTKSKTPPLEPTWKMETSPGNFQWGYAFDVNAQPTKGEYASAIKAIAAAGFTDPGAINPVRNFRLPGSVNLKNGFEAQLVEFHPDRFFTLGQICDALGVDPGEPVEFGPEPVTLKDDGSDDVLAWLNEQGLVYSSARASGWIDVLCPNHAEHSDGNPVAGYLPASRAFCCLHGHCTELDSTSFLTWVAEQGGPARSHGLREELVSSALSGALSRLEGGEDLQDEAKAALAEVERREAGRVEMSGWFERYAYVQADDSYFDLIERRELTRGVFNATYRHVKCHSIHLSEAGRRRRVEASIAFDENRLAKGAHVLAGVTYAAGDSVLVTKDGLVYGNTWRDARPDVAGARTVPIDRWLDHCRKLVPVDSEREHIFDVMAFKLQNPSIKINHAPLHGGTQGCGKDTMWKPFFWAVCGPDQKNFGLWESEGTNAQWGYQYQSEILLLNELKETDARERRALANKLKPIIAAPPEHLTVNRKGLHPYQMPNRLLVVAFSNEHLPLSIDSQDRRWFCIWSHAPRMSEGDGKAMDDWYRYEGGFESIAQWLYQRDVSAFNPGMTPAMTEFKASLVEHGMSSAEAFLVEMMRSRRGEFSRGVIGSPFHALCDRVSNLMPSGAKVPPAALLHALQEAGWVDKGRIMPRDFKSKKHVFCAPELADYPKSELRGMAEPEPPKMALVK